MKKIILLPILALGACFTQPPSEVISGYTKKSWEPKRNEVPNAGEAAETLPTNIYTPQIEAQEITENPQQETQNIKVPPPIIKDIKPKIASNYSLTRDPKRVKQIEENYAKAVAKVEKKIASIEPAAAPIKPAKIQKNIKQTKYITHKVKAGENLYRIGMKYEVSPLDLMAANSFDTPQDLKADTIIRVPLKGTERPATVQKINQQLAKAKGMVWPARGKIIKSFGHKGQGITHTGINIGLPVGTPIVAADSGIVIYANDGLKSYGNLVLLRHKNGVVTAYAHNNSLKVNKTQKVQKGQIIAMSGNSGDVTSPQLHFEVRRNAQAIDPMKVLPR